MRRRWLDHHKTRVLVGLLLMPALATRLLVPPGFMPGTGADRAPTMQMCHGAGPLPAATHPGPAGKDEAPGQDTHHEPPCVFAAAGSAAPPPIAALGPGAIQAPDLAPLAAERVFVQRATHRSQSARGPPFDSRPA